MIYYFLEFIFKTRLVAVCVAAQNDFEIIFASLLQSSPKFFCARRKNTKHNAPIKPKPPMYQAIKAALNGSYLIDKTCASGDFSKLFKRHL